MKKNEVQLLLVVLGILMLVVSWQLIYDKGGRDQRTE